MAARSELSRRTPISLRPPFLTAYALLLCVSALTVALLWPVRYLLLIDEYRNTVFHGAIAVGEEFTIGYIHSVEKTPVVNYFQVTADNKLKLARVRFQSFGAGMPDYAPRVQQSGGWIEYSGFTQAHATMLWNVRADLRHTLSWRRTEYRLGDFVRNGSNVQIKVRYRPWLHYLYYQLKRGG